MRLDRLLADRQVTRYLLVGAAAGEGGEHLQLAGRELVHGVAALVAHLLEHLPRHRRVEHALAPGRGVDRIDHRVDAGGLEQVGDRPGLDGVEYLVVALVGGEDDHLSGWADDLHLP